MAGVAEWREFCSAYSANQTEARIAAFTAKLESYHRLMAAHGCRPRLGSAGVGSERS